MSPRGMHLKPRRPNPPQEERLQPNDLLRDIPLTSQQGTDTVWEPGYLPHKKSTEEMKKRLLLIPRFLRSRSPERGVTRGDNRKSTLTSISTSQVSKQAQTPLKATTQCPQRRREVATKAASLAFRHGSLGFTPIVVPVALKSLIQEKVPNMETKTTLIPPMTHMNVKGKGKLEEQVMGKQRKSDSKGVSRRKGLDGNAGIGAHSRSRYEVERDSELLKLRMRTAMQIGGPRGSRAEDGFVVWREVPKSRQQAVGSVAWTGRHS
jgi:hypothetical protein